MSSLPGDASDFDIFRSLWTNINDATVPQTPPGQKPKACLLMEMPGFSIDPKSFDEDRFDPATQTHPDRAVALLADRVPILAPYFYDTGSHISFFWKQLLETFELSWVPHEDKSLREKYEEAIKMLYGNDEGYINQEKTQLYKNVDDLRKKWLDAKKEESEFWKSCQEDKTGWPENFQTHAGPVVEKMGQAFTEYDNLKSQIEQYEAAIFQYTRGDLSRLLLQQAQMMGQFTKYDAGDGGSALPFYITEFKPKNWWKWFEEEESAKENDGWTQIHITSEESHKSSSETFSKMSASLEASYGGLFKASGGFSKENGSKHLCEKGKKLEISFMVRKVLISRPWLEIGLLKYPTIGIKGLKAGTWSSGDLDADKNTGQFPLLPTAMVVAKEVVIHAESFDSDMEDTFSKMTTNASLSVGIGPFSASGNFSSENGSKNSSSDYNADTKELIIHGAQIIGWVCTPIPHFPAFDA